MQNTTKAASAFAIVKIAKIISRFMKSFLPYSMVSKGRFALSENEGSLIRRKQRQKTENAMYVLVLTEKKATLFTSLSKFSLSGDSVLLFIEGRIKITRIRTAEEKIAYSISKKLKMLLKL